MRCCLGRAEVRRLRGSRRASGRFAPESCRCDARIVGDPRRRQSGRAEGADRLSEEDWQLADQDAVNLIVAATLISRAGTGKNDAKWVANADWQGWSRDLEKTALQIRAAVKAMDQKKMAAAADHLQEVCESCHTKYRPQAPSDGVSRYPFYPKREPAK